MGESAPPPARISARAPSTVPAKSARPSGNTTTVEQPVFAPFVGTVVATLPAGVSLAKSGDAVVSTTAEGRTALQWNLVLYPPLGSYQQQLSFTVNSDSLSIPALQMEVIPVANNQDPAVGFSAGLLSDSVSGNNKLAGGLDSLDTSALRLAQGAGQLARTIENCRAPRRQHSRAAASPSRS